MASPIDGRFLSDWSGPRRGTPMTGPAGGAVPADGDVVINLTKHAGHRHALGAQTAATSRIAALPDMPPVAKLLRHLKRTLGSTLRAYEFMSHCFVELSASLSGARNPVDIASPWAVLVEARGAQGQTVDEPLQTHLKPTVNFDCGLAEHGIGFIKKPFLAHTRNLAKIELLRKRKNALDPRQVLNPERVLD